MTSWARALVAGAAVVLVTAGCGSDEEADASTTPQDVASGVVLDGPDGSPVSGVEVELLVWPAAQSSTAGPSASGGTTAARVDVDVTDAEGEFDLEALASQLSPHAGADGLVGIELRVAESAEAGTRTSVRLERAAGTGVVSVVETEDVVVVLPSGGSAG